MSDELVTRTLGLVMGWFTPTCPVTTREKAWVETRMCWLAEKLGLDRILNAKVILPTREFFPEPFQNTPQDAEGIFHRLCEIMRVNPGSVTLRILPDDEMPGAAGQYLRHERREVATIRLAESQLYYEEVVITILAHELAHEILLGGGLLRGDEHDMEWVTDLLTAFLGLGIFSTNTTIFETQGRDGNSFWWSYSKSGYLPLRVFAYALTCFAYIRGENKPEWSKYLRLDASSGLQQGLKYIRKTGDCLFTLEQCKSQTPWTMYDGVEKLQKGTASVRLATLWQFAEKEPNNPQVLPHLLAVLRDRDPDVLVEAITSIANYGHMAAEYYDEFPPFLQSRSAPIRSAAIEGMVQLTTTPRETAIELSHWLSDDDIGVVKTVAKAVAKLNVALDDDSVTRLLNRIEPAYHLTEEEELFDLLMPAFRVASSNPTNAILEHFENEHDECRQYLLPLTKTWAATRPTTTVNTPRA